VIGDRRFIPSCCTVDCDLEKFVPNTFASVTEEYNLVSWEVKRHTMRHVSSWSSS